MDLTQEHEGIGRNLKSFIDKEINPHVRRGEDVGCAFTLLQEDPGHGHTKPHEKPNARADLAC